jgi:ubiquinone/menaquinone biosynthesis C-methylase UbiE
VIFPIYPKLSMLTDEMIEMHLARQYNWTKNLREMIYDKISLAKSKRVLDAGCGIGLVTEEIRNICGGEVHGVDANERLLEKAIVNAPLCKFRTAWVENLPFEDGYFDITFCHFLLMWVKDPVKVLKEMARVTKPGGLVVCAAEPDYGGKIDYPDVFGSVASMINFLRTEGADPFLGRKLKALISICQFSAETGVFTELWNNETMKREFEFIRDFNLMMAKTSAQKEFVDEVMKKDLQSVEKGEKVTMLPIFWAIASK